MRMAAPLSTSQIAVESCAFIHNPVPLVIPLLLRCCSGSIDLAVGGCSGGGSGFPSRLVCSAGSVHTCKENKDEKIRYIKCLLLIFLIFQLLS
jgi:hypothetical protein